MKRRLILSAATALGTAGVLGLGVQPASALPTTWQITAAGNPAGARFSAGTGHIRAVQLCETTNGQTDFYQTGPWVGINTWSWTGTCQNYRFWHGADLSN